MVRATDGHGKTSDRRPCSLTREAEDLQWDRAYRRVSEDEYAHRRKELEANGRWYKR